jgi:hypothetical protein
MPRHEHQQEQNQSQCADSHEDPADRLHIDSVDGLVHREGQDRTHRYQENADADTHR